MWTVHELSPPRLLSDILDFMRSRLTAQANLKWYRKYWERNSLQADLDHHTARYEDAINSFNVCHSVLIFIGFMTVTDFFCTHHNQITTLIDIYHTVANLPALVQDHARLVTTRRDIHNPASRDVFGSVSSHQDEKVGRITLIFSCLLF